MGILGGVKQKKSGKCHQLSIQSLNIFLHTHSGGGGPGGCGSTFKKCGKFHELPRKSIKKFDPPRGGILGGQTIKSPGNVMNCREKM